MRFNIMLSMFILSACFFVFRKSYDPYVMITISNIFFFGSFFVGGILLQDKKFD